MRYYDTSTLYRMRDDDVVWWKSRQARSGQIVALTNMHAWTWKKWINQSIISDISFMRIQMVWNLVMSITALNTNSEGRRRMTIEQNLYLSLHRQIKDQHFQFFKLKDPTAIRTQLSYLISLCDALPYAYYCSNEHLWRTFSN